MCVRRYDCINLKRGQSAFIYFFRCLFLCSEVCYLIDSNVIRARNYLVHKRAPELFSLTGCMVERLFMNFVVVDSNPVAVF